MQKNLQGKFSLEIWPADTEMRGVLSWEEQLLLKILESEGLIIK